MEKENHKRSSEGPKVKDVRYERHSANAADPDPKKGGHAGWGRPGEGYDEDNIDKNDPNYDEEEEKEVN